MTVSARSVSVNTAPSAVRPMPTRTASRGDALATPWSDSRPRTTAPVPVSFSELAGTRDGGPSGGRQSLQTPWQDTELRRPVAAPVSFSSLPAPVVSPRPQPLTIRSAFVPRPR